LVDKLSREAIDGVPAHGQGPAVLQFLVNVAGELSRGPVDLPCFPNIVISVASISQLVARRTTVKPDEAFLTGLLHGIGRLYIMAHAVGKFVETCGTSTRFSAGCSGMLGAVPRFHGAMR
jgi:HDOD domain